MAAFREDFPEIEAHRTLYEIDRGRLTCAGGIAALDMMRAIIAQQHGPSLANGISGWFLQTHLRLGSGPQRLTLRERYGTSNRTLLKALEAMEASIEKPMPRDQLSRRAGVSIRQLERLFAVHLKTTINAQYLKLRLDHAHRLLHETTMPILDIAVACGFASASHFSRSYKAQYGKPPRGEREAGEF
jgi:transcriptional regulator GlxA family with amidase domain